MSSKAAKRKKEYQDRKYKRNTERDRKKSLRHTTSMEEMAKLMGIKLK